MVKHSTTSSSSTPQTWKRNKCTFYNSDGTIISIIEFDPQAGNEIKCTEYNSDGTIKEVRNL
ncbi:DUF2963 domain-containing protein [Paulownia witches'-broom phytoplasma]|uniref:DUF2963 domain-containing protein n=1 Tax=Paulownia witches'-broom phytoplasma TaxID=39647 RepID=UPI003CC91AC5